MQKQRRMKKGKVTICQVLRPQSYPHPTCSDKVLPKFVGWMEGPRKLDKFVYEFAIQTFFSGLTNLYIFVQENLKSLILYIVDSFWEELTKFEHLSSIQSLKVKYDQVKCPLNAWYFTRLSRLGKNVFYV
eukprot:TRINITY_DN7216_c0_g2_i4.p1 TRINITY_DN7216_c0_g2~~TRINITY_DN7216_c0_g2_i4.p1  ORF type:complete len:130 (-),score=13.13 TRINITY_DN7216_c0_g2_i4:474-863(-)